MPKKKNIGKSAAGVDPAAILTGLEEAIIAVDHEGAVIFANPAAETLLGSDPATTDIWQDILFRNPWLTAGLLIALNESRSHVRHQMPLDNGMGVRTVGCRVTPMFAAEGELIGAICLLMDENSLQALSENVRRQDKLGEVATLAAGLAHEIKNPLGGIMGAAQLLRGEKISTESLECVDVIERDVRRINRLIEQLLDFGHPKKYIRAPINLHRVIDAVLKSLALDPLAKGHSFNRDFDPSLPDLAVSEDGMHQVLLNLVKNALEASNPGTPLTIRTRIDLAGRRVAKRAVLIEVQNEGEDIPAEVRDRLFTPFFTTKKTGSGLGLLVSLRIVREHGGTIDVLSDRGKTVFTVALPMETVGTEVQGGV